MAAYNMNQEVKEIAELTGKTEEQVGGELGLIHVLIDRNPDYCEWTAHSRSEERKVKAALADTKGKIAKGKAKKEFEQKLASGAAVWRRVSGEWLVQITGQEVEAGDIIKVEKRDGSTSDELIKNIVTKNDDGIFARV